MWKASAFSILSAGELTVSLARRAMLNASMSMFWKSGKDFGGARGTGMSKQVTMGRWSALMGQIEGSVSQERSKLRAWCESQMLSGRVQLCMADSYVGIPEGRAMAMSWSRMRSSSSWRSSSEEFR